MTDPSTHEAIMASDPKTFLGGIPSRNPRLREIYINAVTHNKTFARTAPQPYAGKGTFRPAPDATPIDMSGKPVVVCDETLPPASPETVHNVRVANLARTQIDQPDNTKLLVPVLVSIAVGIAFIAWVLR